MKKKICLLALTAVMLVGCDEDIAHTDAQRKLVSAFEALKKDDLVKFRSSLTSEAAKKYKDDQIVAELKHFILNIDRLNFGDERTTFSSVNQSGDVLNQYQVEIKNDRNVVALATVNCVSHEIIREYEVCHENANLSSDEGRPPFYDGSRDQDGTDSIGLTPGDSHPKTGNGDTSDTDPDRPPRYPGSTTFDYRVIGASGIRYINGKYCQNEIESHVDVNCLIADVTKASN